MNRPYMRHSIVDLESMPASPELLAELAHRTVPRARKLLERLRATTAAPTPVAKTAVEPRQTPKRPKAATTLAPKVRDAAPRAPLSDCGAMPDRWQDCTAAQLAWWRDRYSWHSTLFATTWPRRSPAEMHESELRAEKWAKRTARKIKPPIAIKGDDGLAYLRDNLWCVCPGKDWRDLALDRKKRPEQWAAWTSRGPQRVVDPDPPARSFQLHSERWLESYEAKRLAAKGLAAQPAPLPMAA
jgi:hypothetical protein